MRLSDEMLVTETPVAQEALEVTLAPEAPVVPEVPPVPPVPVEQSYTYQPTDEQGRPLGGKQVIKYRTADELTQRLTEQSILLIRKLREETKNRRLGIVDNEAIPDTASRFDAPVDFQPRVLSPDERVTLSRDLLDPERFDEASSTLFEATVGAKPEVLRKTLNELTYSNIQLTALAESQAFMSNHPEYHRCKDNADVLANWMAKNKLFPNRDNFSLAFTTLKAAGLLLEAPIVREDVPPTPPVTVEAPAPTPEITAEPTPANTQPVQDDSSRITTDHLAQAKRPVNRVATGLTRQKAGDVGSAPIQSGYTLAEIDAMPSEVYRRKLLSEKGFAATYERLIKERDEAKQRR